MEAMAGSACQDAVSQLPAGTIIQSIMPHLINMYGACATARDFEIYTPNATYDDPLMRAHGVKQIKSAFYTLPKVLIDNKQFYKILGKPVDLASLITLEIEDGKIVRHEDWWNKKPLKNKETTRLPLVGRLAFTTRRAAMLLTHAIMGFGKDPKARHTHNIRGDERAGGRGELECDQNRGEREPKR
ncbi:hypothetical protein PR202_gb06742 [Eleusine coracana subsp. coracana]|uniref:Uncharacterized protein n=1 Tax=Eleusine coracana subsp. coracana TaxID=191504 RepID=A0AAV5EAR5_ELECO|nr:hypothetical protein PR202_gb06742 [Eleusine coracana subsp. coracana]